MASHRHTRRRLLAVLAVCSVFAIVLGGVSCAVLHRGDLPRPKDSARFTVVLRERFAPGTPVTNVSAVMKSNGFRCSYFRNFGYFLGPAQGVPPPDADYLFCSRGQFTLWSWTAKFNIQDGCITTNVTGTWSWYSL